MVLDAELQQILLQKCSAIGSSFISKGGNRVLAQPSNRMLFAKLGPLAQVMGEAESLAAMHSASVGAGHSEEECLIPTIHAYGTTQDGEKAFLVTDYKNLSGGLGQENQQILGKRLAEMHLSGTSSNGMFGFQRPTHCGETVSDECLDSFFLCPDLAIFSEEGGRKLFLFLVLSSGLTRMWRFRNTIDGQSFQ